VGPAHYEFRDLKGSRHLNASRWNPNREEVTEPAVSDQPVLSGGVIGLGGRTEADRGR
jgi:hypothetical protein